MDLKTLKMLTFTAFFVAVSALTLGHASLTQNLNIVSTASVQNSNATWNIKFTNRSDGVTTNYASKGAITLRDTSVVLTGVVLKAPKDSVTYTWDVVNAGQIDAELDIVTVKKPVFIGTGSNKTADEGLVKSMFKYELTWADGTEIKKGTILNKGEIKHIKLVVSYDENATSLPTNSVTIGNLGLTLLFVQKGYGSTDEEIDEPLKPEVKAFIETAETYANTLQEKLDNSTFTKEYLDTLRNPYFTITVETVGVKAWYKISASDIILQDKSSDGVTTYINFTLDENNKIQVFDYVTPEYSYFFVNGTDERGGSIFNY